MFLRLSDMKYEEFLSKSPVQGTFTIKNLANGKVYIAPSSDLVKSYEKERFALDMGMHENIELQSEYEEMGLELFQIEIDRRKSDEESLVELYERRVGELKKEGVVLY